jgi:hypothetical protein
MTPFVDASLLPDSVLERFSFAMSFGETQVTSSTSTSIVTCTLVGAIDGDADAHLSALCVRAPNGRRQQPTRLCSQRDFG